MNNLKTDRLFVLLIAVLIGLLIGLPTLFWKNSNGSSRNGVAEDTTNQKNMLLFVGGASEISYLDSECSKKVRDLDSTIVDTTKHVFSKNEYPNSMYLHMSSGEALNVLVEEAIMPKSIKSQKFCPICLSAMRADDSMFTETCTKDQIEKAGKIVGYYLGEDSLVIYAQNLEELESVGVDPHAKEITKTQLEKLLKRANKSYRIFTTSKRSGTYFAYNKEVNLDNIENRKFFSSQSSQNYFGAPEQHCIILGTKLYYPTELEPYFDESVRKLYLVHDDDHKIIYTHPLYLYFMAYKEDNIEDEYIVPERVLGFLKTVLNFKDESSMLVDKNKLSKYGPLIIYLNPSSDPNTKN